MEQSFGAFVFWQILVRCGTSPVQSSAFGLNARGGRRHRGSFIAGGVDNRDGCGFGKLVFAPQATNPRNNAGIVALRPSDPIRCNVAELALFGNVGLSA